MSLCLHSEKPKEKRLSVCNIKLCARYCQAQFNIFKLSVLCFVFRVAVINWLVSPKPTVSGDIWYQRPWIIPSLWTIRTGTHVLSAQRLHKPTTAETLSLHHLHKLPTHGFKANCSYTFLIILFTWHSN